MARVFIGIPTINRPDYVRQTIDSVLGQTFGDIEVIVSDNGSDAGVAESVEKYISGLGDERIRFHQQPTNLGEYGQGRYFLAAAENSEYFVILHDDDILYEDYLRRAVEVLDHQVNCAYFVADASIIDENGEKAEQVRRRFSKEHGRSNAKQGVFSVVSNHLSSGFTLISGTVFRTNALRTSGFVGAEGAGNYPFESEIFLCLGDIDAIAWFQKEELIAIRYHTNSLRHHTKLLENEKVVDAMIRIFACRAYRGANERRRKVILGRLYRAKALISVRQGDYRECRKLLVKCFTHNVFSIKLWLVSPLALFMPGILNYLLPALPEVRDAPLLKQEKQC